EMFHLRRALGSQVWPGWGEAEIPVIVHNEAYVFLVGYPEGETPPDGWVRVPRDEQRGGPWEAVPGDTFQGQPYYRQQLVGTEETPENFTVRVGESWAVTLWTREYARVSFFSEFPGEVPPLLRPVVPYRLVWRFLLGATETYVGALAHEAFHAYQGMEAPERLYAAEFAGPLESGYPWHDDEAESAWQAELDALHGAVKASSDAEAADLAGEFLVRREERRRAHALSGEMVDFERQREWLEGLAKYAELSIQLEAALDEDYSPVPEIHDDPHFNGYGSRERFWRQQVDEITRMTGRSGEVRFYYSGFAQGVLLDRLMPDWKSRVWDEDVWLETLLAEAVELQASGIRPKRLYFLGPGLVAALAQHTIHESTHYVAARLLHEQVAEFRFLTNGWLTSRVIYATPVGERAGAHWLLIAWAPAVVTTLIGYALYRTRARWLTDVPLLNALLWFATAYFLLVDALYFALLSPFFGGGDVAAVAAVGWPRWPVHVVSGLVLLFNVRLVYQLRQESKAQPERYLPAERS
ncbi:MAG: hypothetical protein R6X31_15710, partial [Anaerolineae bacterium]